MGLLTDLKAAAPTELDQNPWTAVRRVLPMLVPNLVFDKVDVINTGRVAMRGKTPMRGRGMYYFIMVMEPVGTGLEDGRRQVRLGVARYRDEADAALFDQPFTAYLDPQPGMIGAWLAGVLLTRTLYDSGLP